MTCSHRQNTDIFLYDDEPLVLIHNLDVAALERLLVALGLADGHLHATFQLEVKLCHGLAVDLDTTSLQRRLDLGATLLDVFQQPFQQRLLFVHHVVIILTHAVISSIHSHCSQTVYK